MRNQTCLFFLILLNSCFAGGDPESIDNDERGSDSEARVPGDSTAPDPDSVGSPDGECPAGFQNIDGMCRDIDGCANEPCFESVECTDLSAPALGFRCGECPLGFEGSGRECFDADGCQLSPCADGTECTDVPAPGTGFTCGDCPANSSDDGSACVCNPGYYEVENGCEPMLTEIGLSAGSLNPRFSPEATVYRVELPTVGVSEFSLTPFVSSGVVPSINGSIVTPSTASPPTSLRLGLNTFDIGVSISSFVQSYRVDVVRDPITYVKATNPDEDDRFGSAIAISGDTLVVGAPNESADGSGQNDNSISGAGAVYVYRLMNDTWTFEAYLKPELPGGEDNFGWSVALEGDTLVVGAPGEDSDAAGVDGDQTNSDSARSGAAYVYDRSGAEWSQTAFLKAGSPDSGDDFGTAVAYSGDRIVVGAPDEGSASNVVGGDATDNTANEVGAAYIFVRLGNGWLQEEYLKASNAEDRDHFGESVAIFGTTVVVGASDEDSNSTVVNGLDGNDTQGNSEFGAAYVFERISNVWNQTAYLKPSDNSSSIRFGKSVCTADGVIAVGASGKSSSSGGFNLFARRGSTWAESLASEGSSFGRSFFQGDSIACAPDRVVISSRQDGPKVFELRAGQWMELSVPLPAVTEDVDIAGAAVAIDDDRAVAGAPQEQSGSPFDSRNPNDNSRPSAGAVYVY
ncbi:MAG: FG-GAP repeat protein [Myxococcota bacterium]